MKNRNCDITLGDVFGNALPEIERQARIGGFRLKEYLKLKFLRDMEIDLTAAQGAALMNVSRHTFMRYYHRGMFPHAYQLNSRVIRFPISDIRQAKKDRTLLPCD